MSRTLNIALNLLSAVLVTAGLVLVAAILLAPFLVPSPTVEAGSPGVSQTSGTGEQNGESADGSTDEKSGGDVPDTSGTRETPVAPVPPESPESSGKSSSEDAQKVESGPENKTLEVSIPAMGRVEDNRVPSTTGGDEEALRKNVAIHLEGTGFPWQREANVYMAGHRIGYPGTDSFLGFYDLHKLEKGDEIHVRDADGGRYTYKVYREEVVGPRDMTVTEPIQDRNILTLQTCTLPNYNDRLIVQAEKVA